MTVNSGFKKRVRARMKETGERYTVARHAVEAAVDCTIGGAEQVQDQVGGWRAWCKCGWTGNRCDSPEGADAELQTHRGAA